MSDEESIARATNENDSPSIELIVYQLQHKIEVLRLNLHNSEKMTARVEAENSQHHRLLQELQQAQEPRTSMNMDVAPGSGSLAGAPPTADLDMLRKLREQEKMLEETLGYSERMRVRALEANAEHKRMLQHLQNQHVPQPSYEPFVEPGAHPTMLQMLQQQVERLQAQVASMQQGNIGNEVPSFDLGSQASSYQTPGRKSQRKHGAGRSRATWMKNRGRGHYHYHTYN